MQMIKYTAKLVLLGALANGGLLAGDNVPVAVPAALVSAQAPEIAEVKSGQLPEDLKQAFEACAKQDKSLWERAKSIHGENCYKRVKYLVDAHSNLNVRNPENKRTLLHAIAQGAHAGAMCLALRHGADQDMLDREGNTPLVVAAHAVVMQNRNVDTLAELARHGGVLTAELTAHLGNLIIKDKTREVKKLLNLGLPVAAFAMSGFDKVEFSSPEMLEILIKAEDGALLKMPSDVENPLLHEMVRLGRYSERIVRHVNQLVKAGVDVNKRNCFGDTALHFAVKRGDAQVVCALVKNGARATIADGFGKTPLDYYKLDLEDQKKEAKKQQTEPNIHDVLTAAARIEKQEKDIAAAKAEVKK